MEMDNENKLGGGIITISVLTFIGRFLAIIGSIMLLGFKDSFEETYKSLEIEIPSDKMELTILILSIILIVSTILILMKNKIGVFGYFIVQAISIIISIASSGFSISSLIIDLLFPVLMAIFIYKKKHLYFNS